MQEDSVLEVLEEALDIINRLEERVRLLKPRSELSPGVLYQLYTDLLLLREKVITARMKVSKYSEQP
ncbi:MAG: hypothetical protein OWQ48_05625 [Desulfurococcus sp.]|nr:hypothetical protein [Desulfurococcus sp.]